MAGLPSDSAVILVDGDCALCNGYARFVAAWDTANRFYFETQQSPEGRALLEQHGQACDLSTIITIERHGRDEDSHMYKKSTAVLRTLARLAFPMWLLYVFILIPTFIRDPIYDLVARNRIRIFGKTDKCELPPAALRKKMSRPIP